MDIEGITVTVSGAVDALGNTQLLQIAPAATPEAEFDIDTLNPTVVISDNQAGTAFDDANTVTYTLTFAENVQSVTAADIDVSGAALDTDGDAIYSVAHTPNTTSDGYSDCC